jgi:hypothetical protein
VASLTEARSCRAGQAGPRRGFGEDTLTDRHGLKFGLATKLKPVQIPFEFESVPIERTAASKQE